jgi:excisionase family DNA binding protein
MEIKDIGKELQEIKDIGKELQEIKKLLSVQKEILNIDELSQLTGFSKSTIYKKTHTGQIPHYKQSKHLFFDRSEIINWLKANKGFDADQIDSKAATYVTLNAEGK